VKPLKLSSYNALYPRIYEFAVQKDDVTLAKEARSLMEAVAIHNKNYKQNGL
jgi:hypothetical protein